MLFRSILFFFITTSLFTLPQDHNVVHGSAELQSLNPGELIIHTDDKTIIEWGNFSIFENKMTCFIQPNAQAAVLNRVISGEESIVDGTLQANGQVYLINPNGIFFGANAIVNTASFLASTMDLLNDDFLNKENWTFTGSSEGMISNKGNITASDGNIFLFSYQVENEGSLSAPQGVVGLAAGGKVLLKKEGTEKIFIQAALSNEEDEIGVDQKGVIDALQAEIKAQGDLYSIAINHEGRVDANGIEEIEGRIFLRSEEGTSMISGSMIAQNEDQTGGEIQLLGKKITLDDQADINVSGKLGGGTILLGGDNLGENPSILNADEVFVGTDVRLCADAIDEGNGGKIILWGNESNQFFGSVTAKGGKNSGDGGFIEISSPNFLFPDGIIHASASNGKPGLVLFDPTDITVVLDPGPPAESGFTNPPLVFTAGTAFIFNTTLSAILQGGTSLAINATTTPHVAPSGGTFTVNPGADISWTTNSINFSVTAVSMDIQASINNSGSSASTVTLTPTTGDIVIGGSGQTANIFIANAQDTGLLTINSARDVIMSTTAGNITRANANGGLMMTAGRHITGTGLSAADHVFVGSQGIDGASQPTTLTAQENVSFTNFRVISNNTLTITVTDGDVSLTSSTFFRATDGGSMSVTAGNDITVDSVTDATGYDSGSVFTAGNDLTIQDSTLGGIGGVVSARYVAGNDIMTTNSTITNSGGELQFKADRNGTVTNSTLSGTGGSRMSFIVDNAVPAAPFTGPGTFTLDATSALNGSQVRVYTSVPAQNTFEVGSMMNATPYNGPAENANNQYFVYFPGGTYTAPFTVFYKAFVPFTPTPPFVPPGPPDFGTLIAILQSEMLTMMQRYERSLIWNQLFDVSITINGVTDTQTYLQHLENFLIPQFE